MLVTRESLILTSCLQKLNQLPDVQASCEGDVMPGADSHLKICSPQQCVDYICEVQPNIKKESIGAVLSQLEYSRQHHNHPPLLLTKYLPDSITELLVSKGVEFIDTVGNIYLNSPAAYILVRGNRLPKSEGASKSALTPAGLQLVYILLRDPDLLNAQYRQLSEWTGISLGAVSGVIQNLYSSGYLQKQRKGGYQIVNYRKLLSFWELGYAEKLRDRLLIGTFSSGSNRPFAELMAEIQKGAAAADYLIGGELGAAIATDYLHPTRATLHVKDHHQIVVKLRLRPDPKGEVAILRQFGTQNAWVSDRVNDLADPLLIRGELLIENNDRLRETASLLFDRFIAGRSHDITGR